MSIGELFIQASIKKFQYQKSQVERAIAQLNEGDLFIQTSTESNSIAIIMQHLNGNMKSRWTNFLTDDGEKTWRQRDEEFEPIIRTKHELVEEWESGWRCLWAALNSLQSSDLVKDIFIRQQPLTVVDAIIRQIDHYGYHTGQIVFIAKMIKDASWQHISMPKKIK